MYIRVYVVSKFRKGRGHTEINMTKWKVHSENKAQQSKFMFHKRFRFILQVEWDQKAIFIHLYTHVLHTFNSMPRVLNKGYSFDGEKKVYVRGW